MNNFEALTKIATLLAESKVKETLEYYHEPADKAPPLSECVQWLEELLSSLPDDIKTKYSFELNGIHNEIADLKTGHYYERLEQCGVPMIFTIGDRICYRISLLETAVITGQPGFLEES